jgi:osmoprotectant transport system ATP-binding protein
VDGSAGGAVEFQAVVKRYPNGTVAVDELTLDISSGELVVLIGPSGCGKTTTLKMVNRLVQPSAGRVLVGGDDVMRVDAVSLRRRIGYVIQQVGLFPHHDVLRNVMTVPTLLGWDRRKARSRSEEMLHLVGLDPAQYAGRYPHQLSGGQQQRVGVARALAADPPVLLMDEPFGAVDPIARDRLQTEFLELHRRLKKTVLFVTHDVSEAVRLATRMAVFRQGGVLQQYADPATVLGAPANDFVADFVGRDRALTRLAVTPIDTTSLDQPAVVSVTDELTAAGVAVDRMGAGYAVTVDGNGGLSGWLARADMSGSGVVRDRLRPVDGLTVAKEASLKDVLAALLGSDVGWLGVVDGNRFLGGLTPALVYAQLRGSLDQKVQ